MPKSSIPWALPFALGLAGLSLVALLAWRWTHSRPALAGGNTTRPPSDHGASGETAQEPAPDEAYSSRLDDELRDLD